MNEMKTETVNRCSILWKAIERRLGTPPVVTIAPIVDESSLLCERHPLRPVVDRLALRPARIRQPFLQIAERALWRLIGEWCDFVIGLPEYGIDSKQHCCDRSGKSDLNKLTACSVVRGKLLTVR